MFAINNTASTLGDTGRLTPFFINCSAHPRLPLTSPAACHPNSASPALYARRMRALELQVSELLAAAQQERKEKQDAGRVDTVFKWTRSRCCCGPRSQAAAKVGRAFRSSNCLP